MASKIVKFPIPKTDQLLSYLEEHVAAPSWTEDERRRNEWDRLARAPYPKSLNDCLLHIFEAPATPGSGQTSWGLRGPLHFKTDYVVTFSEDHCTVQLRLSSSRWVIDVSGYVIKTGHHRRWICPTCGRKNAILFVRISDGSVLCYRCGYDAERHFHFVMQGFYPSWPWSHENERSNDGGAA